MELTINLLARKKSNLRIGFGMLAILFSILWIWIALAEKESLKIFDMLYFLVFLTLGIGHLIEGTGVSLVGFFGGKALIHINDKEIRIKQEPFTKGETIQWDELKSIKYKSAQYRITKTDDSTLMLKIPTDDYNRVQSIKETIKTFAGEKGIQIE
ncbi:hypothetical protein [Saccharicrinis carchari]|nr:hypothetical protein [Saccharicrinis carchari]